MTRAFITAILLCGLVSYDLGYCRDVTELAGFLEKTTVQIHNELPKLKGDAFEGEGAILDIFVSQIIECVDVFVVCAQGNIIAILVTPRRWAEDCKVGQKVRFSGKLHDIKKTWCGDPPRACLRVKLRDADVR